ncbi:cyclin-dependent kinase 4 [Cephus cinctus]|uniref:cyclin-dependent kinase n=1 Tax=Cephus cinctus TaxID=211228 RepID=A0AAJ7RUY8_CEPCN|nr:cyclin-dependent kinase 4 [Cephus cinctus]XP_015609372.1 cyclin-dependent kinase 4 [Cephus cinctus]XP_015609373.1 cyclin-dependent kinase 4 [Cephus cinctus]XP_015609374.1 cyclin-dependent kinase 4 [Cephus cinctus]XP_015609375.1 cyclin-dependent kinase 4 [Cephus cinctus]XP_015609376.1 cyclin-dependent kinase 4 [Cephus cinctus]XP_024947618.1 cyclin-dependent kinase 4 [Cephus cinctus]XP_024947619.1 cyclin-dependent kinase 4 [Cephus cinctus]XP_024947620.1 cyclin-dependent kinase 4 [Cephus ci
MAERRRFPSSELDPDLSSPTPPKRPKQAGDAESDDETEQEAEKSLETSEKLSSPEALPGTSSSGAGTSRPKELGGIKDVETTEESEEPVPDVGQVAGPSKQVEPMTSEKDEEPGTSSRIEVRRIMGRESTGEVQTSLMGEHALYQELSLIGNGAYGTVYKAKDLTSGQVVALKKVRVPLTEDGLPTSTLREIAALKQLERFEHPHIVRLLDVCQGNYLQLPSEDERSERVDRGLILWLVFEHVERDLASYMSSCSNGIPPEDVKRMSREIILGVDFLHSHRILHRDLKPQNLLVTHEGRIKIADFGLAKTYDFEMRLTSVVVTLWYRAPEVLLGCPYATPVDIWSVGCILAELSRLSPLFPGTSEGDQLDRIFQVIGTPSQDEWPENVSLSWTAFPHRQARPLRSIIPNLNDHGLDLIKNTLIFDPHSRITAAQALRHQYFVDESS